MPKIPTNRTKKAPAGFGEIEPRLQEFQQQMRDAEQEPNIAKRKVEAAWKILMVNHQRSRFIYNAFYVKKDISRELYDFLIREKFADANLIAKWKKNGYEKLCCILCVQNSTNFGGVCICRVPKGKLESNKLMQCNTCGCRGCASCD